MCGICGFVLKRPEADTSTLRALVQRMTATLVHRGPDDSDIWVDQQTGVAFGHTRLSILDLSSAGRQPMSSASGRYVIVYNGEIYNFRELHKELKGLGYVFRGHSDTEVLLAAIEEWGVGNALLKLNGMFAFGLWDRARRQLTLSRDRVGKKPLYYGWCGNSFLFSSELKALRPHPDFDPEIDREALGLYIRYGWVPGPLSIHPTIRKLVPGTLLRVSGPEHGLEQPKSYWSAREVSERGAETPFSGDTEAAERQLDTLLRDAVRKRMIAEVNLGALLSGGVDSSTVVAMMQSQSLRPVKTFSIGFHESRYNEAEHARATADFLGTEHTELYVTPRDSLELIPRLPEIYDEPFADPSGIPTYLVARLAREHVTVALSGDGGDELFGGYSRYRRCTAAWAAWGSKPRALRAGLAWGCDALAQHAWNLLGPRKPSVAGPIAKWRRVPVKWQKKTRLLPAEDTVALFALIRDRCGDPQTLVPGLRGTDTLLTDRTLRANVDQPIQSMMYLDFAGYLPDNNLVKVDRASMAVSLEIRCPLLDYRVVEFARGLPVAMLLDEQGGKAILRRVLARYIPPQLTDRPKWGFGVPVAAWLQGPLREWAEDLLEPGRLASQGLLSPRTVQKIWRQHISGWLEQPELVWNILMFQAWHEAWSNRKRGC